MQETSTPSIFCHFLHPALTVQKLRICQIRPFSYLFSPFQTKNNLICFVFSQLFRKTKQLEQTQFAPEKVGKHLLHPHPLCLSALIWHRHTQVIWRVANQVIQLRKYTNSLRFGRKKNRKFQSFQLWNPMKNWLEATFLQPWKCSKPTNAQISSAFPWNCDVYTKFKGLKDDSHSFLGDGTPSIVSPKYRSFNIHYTNWQDLCVYKLFVHQFWPISGTSWNLELNIQPNPGGYQDLFHQQYGNSLSTV